MRKVKLPNVPRPCEQCPFRKDCMKAWLGAARMKEILKQDSFVCHKTAYGADKDRRQCAGHMILKGEANAFVRLAKSMEIELKLTGQELVFDTEKDCIEHHRNK